MYQGRNLLSRTSVEDRRGSILTIDGDGGRGTGASDGVLALANVSGLVGHGHLIQHERFVGRLDLGPEQCHQIGSEERRNQVRGVRLLVCRGILDGNHLQRRKRRRLGSSRAQRGGEFLETGRVMV